MSRLNRFLTGLRVVDLSRHLPGPFATLMLGDMGADVQRIEPPNGDDLRRAGPIGEGGRSVYFDALHAGKSTRRLDLRDSPQREQLLELVDHADVLLESFRPGVMERLGLDYPAVSQRNPQLIYCSLTGFGSDSEYAQTAARDGNFLALSGLLERNGIPERPTLPVTTMADYAGSMTLLTTLLGALYARTRDGRGARIEVALADAVMPMQLLEIAEHGAMGHLLQRGFGRLTGASAAYQPYRTRDGRFVMLAAFDDLSWARFCTAAERPEWISRSAEPTVQEDLIDSLRRYFESVTSAECITRFSATDCYLTPILDLAEAIDSSHYRQAGFIREDGAAFQTLLPALVDGEKPALRPAVREL